MSGDFFSGDYLNKSSPPRKKQKVKYIPCSLPLDLIYEMKLELHAYISHATCK